MGVRGVLIESWRDLRGLSHMVVRGFKESEG